MKRVLKYPGSKWNIAKDIVALIPEHKSYLEPFFGSGAVVQILEAAAERQEEIENMRGGE